MSEAANDIRKVTYAGIAVNVVIAVLKFVGGIVWNSQARVSAFRMMSRRSRRMTYSGGICRTLRYEGDGE